MSIREITREELDRDIQRYGADEDLRSILRELDAEETQEKARHLVRKIAVDQAMEKARQKRAALDSIAESPVWKDMQFVNKLSQSFIAKDLEKSRETTKHYIDSTKQPATRLKSRMGIPKRGADGRVTWDTSAESGGISAGQFDPASANLRKAQQGSLQNCGQCAYYNQDKTCQIVTGPVSSDLTCDKFTGIPAKPLSIVVGAASRDSVQRSRPNITADGKLDPRISIMGHPVRQADGSIKWVAK